MTTSVTPRRCASRQRRHWYLLAGSLSSIKARGDTSRVVAFREEVRQMVKRRELLGVDMTKIKLTSKGIEQR